MVRRSVSTGPLACSRSRSKEPSSSTATARRPVGGQPQLAFAVWFCSAEPSNSVNTHGEQWQRSLAFEAAEALACPAARRYLSRSANPDARGRLELAADRISTVVARLSRRAPLVDLCRWRATADWFGRVLALVGWPTGIGLLDPPRPLGRGDGHWCDQGGTESTEATAGCVAFSHGQPGFVSRARRTWLCGRNQPSPLRNRTAPLRSRLNQRPRLRAMACNSRRRLGISFGCTTAPRIRSSNCALRMRMCSVEVSTRYIWPR